MHENSILLFLRINMDRCKNLILNIFRWEEKNWIMSVEKNKKEKEKKSLRYLLSWNELIESDISMKTKVM